MLNIQIINKMDSNITIYEDVDSCRYDLCKTHLRIQYSHHPEPCEDKKSSRPHYFLLDCPGENAFVHWIFETFVFYYMIDDLTPTYPSLVLYCHISKRYVRDFLKFFNITHSCSSDISSHPCNVLMVPPVFSLNDKSINISLFQDHVVQFREACRSRLPESTEKNIDLCLLPRQRVENYAPNDIVVNVDLLAVDVRNRGGVVMDTFETGDVAVQMDTILRSKIIILNYGSAYFVNGIVARDSLLLVIDTMGAFHSQVIEYPALNQLHTLICSQNRVVILPRGTALTWTGISPFMENKKE